jgi:predicted  nucleic acid-binding Zn-ribbon protein
MSLTDLLQHLQNIDQEWDAKARRYQAVSGQLGDQSELEERRRSHRELADELATTRGALRDSELELTSFQQKARETEQALYGGRVTSPKELEGLHKDLAVLRRRIGALEDTVLEAMERVEELSEAEERGARELGSFEEGWTRERGEMASDYRELRVRLKEIQEERARLREQLDPAVLRLYDELRAKKGGQALSPLQDRVCQTCRVTQPSHKVQVVVSGNQVVTCEGCGRILYWEPALPVPRAQPPAGPQG